MTQDPFDYSRSLVFDHAGRAATYAALVQALAELRDDDGALRTMQRLVFEVRAASDAMKLIVAEGERKRNGGLE